MAHGPVSPGPRAIPPSAHLQDALEALAALAHEEGLAQRAGALHHARHDAARNIHAAFWGAGGEGGRVAKWNGKARGGAQQLAGGQRGALADWTLAAHSPAARSGHLKI